MYRILHIPTGNFLYGLRQKPLCRSLLYPYSTMEFADLVLFPYTYSFAYFTLRYEAETALMYLINRLDIKKLDRSEFEIIKV